MAGTPIQFAKFSGTPHPTQWAHTYNAGSLFAVFSLTKEDANDPSLNAAGKTIINNLEAEFFTIEDKTLESIANAITEALKDVPSEVSLDMAIAYSKDDILYVFLKGRGEITIKRDDKVGTLLKQDEKTIELKRASGRLLPNDRVLLTTQKVASSLSLEDKTQVLTKSDLDQGMDLLAGNIKDDLQGDAAALLLRFNPETVTNDNFVVPQDTTSSEEKSEAKPEEDVKEPKPESKTAPELHRQEEMMPEEQSPMPEPADTREHMTHPLDETAQPKRKRSNSRSFSPRSIFKPRLLLLVAAIIILLVLIVGVGKTLKKKTTVQSSANFHQLYDPAQKAYDEGTGLENLNKQLAHDDYVKAKNLLSQATGKFKDGTPEATQIADLEKKLDDKLSGASSAHQVSATETTSGSDLLQAAMTQPAAKAAAQDGDSLYFLSTKAVTKTDTSGKSAKDVITNNSDWTDAPGLGAYLGNIYVLDKQLGVLKYVAGTGGYGKSNYFTTKPDLSKAVDMAIDGSVWILTSDGQILKYTKGTADSYTVSGLPAPLSHPLRIVTNADLQNVYVLDTGNSTIVKFDKNGAYQQTYGAPVLAKATLMDIDEKTNNAYVLSGNKVYQLPLQ